MTRKPPSAGATEIARALYRQLAQAQGRDFNPFRRGLGPELLSNLPGDFPEIARLTEQSVPLDGAGWLSGDLLYLLADLAEKEASGLVELQAPEGQALLWGLTPEGQEKLWNSALAKNLRPSQSPAQITPCPHWGPCLGQRGRFWPFWLKIYSSLKDAYVADLKIALLSCPRDCRFFLERSDLVALISEDQLSLEIWVGGRRRPFHPLLTPEKWLSGRADAPQELIKALLKAQDLFLERRNPPETLPETFARLGLPDPALLSPPRRG